MPLVVPELLDGVLCESHERTVANDNCVSFGGTALQIPRPTHHKVRVSMKRHLDGALSIWHRPRKLSQHDGDGRPIPNKTPQRGA